MIDTEQKMAGLATDLELAAKLLRGSGLIALRTTAAWTAGPKSPNLDPSAGGWRWENIGTDDQPDIVPVPADATGEAILHADKAGLYHGRYAAALKFTEQAIDELIRITRIACPDPKALRLDVGEMTPAQISAAGWCVSCYRDDKYLNPIAIRPNGQRRYRDLCNWCGEFAAAHDSRQPPVVLVAARRAGKRVTERMVDDALAADDTERRETRKKNRKKKKGR